MATANGPSVKESPREKRERRHREARIEHVRQRADHARTITEFQPDAVELEQRKVPGGARWTLYAVAAFISAFVFWSSWAQVDQIVVGTGKLITTENAVVVQSFSSAPIHSLEVKFGDRVIAGQLVATLDPTFSEADLNQLKARQNAALAKIARLRAELEGTGFSIQGHREDREWETQQILYRERKREMRAELEKFDAEITKLEVGVEKNLSDIQRRKTERIPVFEKLLANQAKLKEQRSASIPEYESAKIRLDDEKKAIFDAENLIKEINADLLYKQKEKAAFVAALRSATADEFSKFNQELTAVEQEINKANRMDELLELRVPTDSGHDEFVVFEVADRSVGSVLQKGEALFKLIPIDVPLEAEVEISGRDVGKIRAIERPLSNEEIPNGSKVTLKLDAFDYQDHGTLTGYVRTVSEGVFEKKDETAGSSANFKARIQILDLEQLTNLPDDFRLMPGMKTTAEIKVGKRRVIHYFLYPVLRYMDEGLREP